MTFVLPFSVFHYGSLKQGTESLECNKNPMLCQFVAFDLFQNNDNDLYLLCQILFLFLFFYILFNVGKQRNSEI